MDKFIDENGWLYCPQCRQKTEYRVRSDTMVYHWPMCCPRCHRESVVNIFEGKVELTSFKKRR